jgi:hypothetical protein
MFSEPFVAHPAEIRGVDGTRHTHSGNYEDRHQHHDEADDEQHMVATSQAAYSNPDTRPADWLCACAQDHRAPRTLEMSGLRGDVESTWLSCHTKCCTLDTARKPLRSLRHSVLPSWEVTAAALAYMWIREQRSGTPKPTVEISNFYQ